MDRLPRRTARSDRPPYIGKPVLDYLTGHPDAPTDDDAWQSLGKEQGELVRHALKRADVLRENNADPGDAFLAGVLLASTAIGEQMEREAFLRDMMNDNDPKASVATGADGGA